MGAFAEAKASMEEFNAGRALGCYEVIDIELTIPVERSELLRQAVEE